MNRSIAAVTGTVNIGSRHYPKGKPNDCSRCKHGWMPDGEIVKITRDDGSVFMQVGKSVICMDESKDKRIDMYDGDMYCSKFELKDG